MFHCLFDLRSLGIIQGIPWLRLGNVEKIWIYFMESLVLSRESAGPDGQHAYRTKEIKTKGNIYISIAFSSPRGQRALTKKRIPLGNALKERRKYISFCSAYTHDLAVSYTRATCLISRYFAWATRWSAQIEKHASLTLWK